MDFVSFHTHTTHSIGDGLKPVATHVDRVADLGMSALFLSEHGVVNSHPALEQECERRGIKPGYGVEVYFGPVGDDAKTQSKTHLTIFAMNEEGYRNLNRIVTQSYRDFYQYPTVSLQNLMEHNRGIVVFSGCADSLLSCTLLGGKFLGPRREEPTEKAILTATRRVERFAEIFGDRYYLEVQRFSNYSRTRTLNPILADISRHTGVPLIATADVHYPFPGERKMQQLLHAANWGGAAATPDAEWEHGIPLTYPESDEEMVNDLVGTGLELSDATAALQATTELAKRCTVVLPKAKPLRFTCDLNTKTGARNTARQQLLASIQAGWRRRSADRADMAARKDEYLARVKHEFAIIVGKDFADYFLVIADLVRRAKDRDTTVGPARGSAAASLISYLLGITEIDPLHPLFSKMVFERFIDPNRSDMPDIDLDFDDGLRWQTEQDAREIYGDENVCNVANHTKYRGKKALKAAAKAHGLPLETFKEIGKRCAVRVETDDRVDDSIKDVLENYATLPSIAKLAETHPNALRFAMFLEGDQQSMGIHAGGYVIASEPIPDVCAIYTRTKGQGRKRQQVQVIPYEKRDSEYLNMLKVDFLGSSTMGAIGLMRKETGVNLDILYNLIYKEYDRWIAADQRKAFKGNVFDIVLQSFRDDDVVGIMQFEGGTTRAVCRAVQPKDFDELAACTALSRPGPYYGGQYTEYVAVKNGEKDWERIHDKGFDQHVDFTFGQIVYQEQIMWILRDLAGFDNKEVLRVRKIIGKKLGEFQFEAIWTAFRDGCKATCDVDEETARRVFSAIRTAAGYAFNIAHAYSYALIAWWQMWFKIKHVEAFFMGTLSKNGEDKDKLPRRTAVLQDAELHKIRILTWDAQFSDVNWRIRYGEKPGLVPGFMQIPKIGEAIASDIVKWRNELPFEMYPSEGSWWDAMGRPAKKGGCPGVGQVTVEKIKELVAQKDPLGVNRTRDQLRAFRKQLADGAFEGTPLPQTGYHMADELPGHADVAFVGLVANVVYRDEIDREREKTGQSVDEIKKTMKDPEKSKKAVLFAYDESAEVAVRISRWRYPNFAARLEQIEEDHHIIVVWGNTYETNANSIQVKMLWILEPD